jgi:TPR repeat protein
MIKSFALCSLPDLKLEISLAIALKNKINSKNAAAAAELLPCFTNSERTEGVLQRHALVRSASGLVCNDTTESEEAWRAMLRDLCGVGVTDSVVVFLHSVCKECACRGIVRAHSDHPFLAGVAAHPAFELSDPAFMFELNVQPAHCLASRRSLERLGFMLKRKCTPSQAFLQLWHAVCIGIGRKQQRALLCRGALFSALVLKLLCFQGKSGSEYQRIPAESIVTRCHFLGSKKNQGERLFEQGVRLYGEQRFSESAQSWGHAALLRHGPSHAHLSNMMFEGREGVPFNKHRAFQLASAGVALGCVHSKGALGRCYISDLFQDVAKGLALARESAAAGSCFGQFVVGACYGEALGVNRDRAEAIRLYRIAAAQGHAGALYTLHVCLDDDGKEAEAMQMCRLAAAQGHAGAQCCLGLMFQEGRGVKEDRAEAVRLYRLSAAQGHATAQFNLGYTLKNPRDEAEAIRWFRLCLKEGHLDSKSDLDRVRLDATDELYNLTGKSFKLGQEEEEDDEEESSSWMRMIFTDA